MRAICEDFVAEGLSLASVMGGLRDADFRTGTAFQGWTLDDVLGIERPERDSVRHVALLGAQTYGWSFAVHGARPPGPMPAVRLTLPSGATLDLGGDPTSGLVEGAAVEFAQVVAQTRNVEDTALQVTDGAARRWMAVAQCFAGPPAVPPPPGTRFRRGCTP
ncbi:MAG: hypothetical protein WCK73_08620 [Deltaproteobacteria bacterium]